MRRLALVVALLCAGSAFAATTVLPLTDGWRFKRNEGGGNYERDFQLERMSAWLDDIGRDMEKSPRMSRRPKREPGANHPFVRPDFNDALWRAVSLPHDWGVEGAFNADRNPEEALLDGVGIGWYRRSLPVDPSWLRDGMRVHFACDGACGFVMVWLNGSFVGGWPSSHTPWRIDLTDSLRDDGPNVLAVRVQQFALANRWYSGAGLTRSCALEVRPMRHVVPNSVFITTPDVCRDRATVNVAWMMSDGEKKSDRFVVVKPRLWDVDDPFLYSYELDGDVFRYGIRSIDWTPNDGFHLNGRRVCLNGVCLHQDLGPIGNVWNRGLWLSRLQMLKACGVNAVRMSHYRHADGLYALCDELGLLVLDEFFDQWELGFNQNDYHRLFPDWHERDLRASIRANRNHPSIVLYSLGNEITEQRNDVIPGDYGLFERLGRRLLSIAREEDPTRPFTTANNGRESWHRPETQFVDVYGFNYDPSHIAAYHAQHPSMPMVSTESGCLLGTRGEYFFPLDRSWTRVNGHLSSYCLTGILTPDEEWAAQDTTPALAGSFFWTGFDYLGGPFGSVRAGVHTCPTGMFDLGDVPRDACWLYRSRFRPDERFVHLLPHWNWPDRLGQNVPVMAFSSADAAELFVNGVSQGRRQRAAGEYRFRWDDVVYAPGKVVCKTWKKGEPWAETAVETTGAAARLVADVMPHEPGDDIVRVQVRVVDAANRVVPRSRVPVRVTVQKPGVFLGATNGDEADLTAFRSETRDAFNGYLSVLVRRTATVDEPIVVRFESPRCGSCEVTVRDELPRTLLDFDKTRPVAPDDTRLPLADPYVMQEDGVYYAYGTSDATKGFTVCVSHDLVNWKTNAGRGPDGRVFSKGDGYGQGSFWAPECHRHKGRYYLFYTADMGCAVAVGDSPLGPFANATKEPLVKADHYPNGDRRLNIDNSFVLDEQGRPWMTYSRGARAYLVRLTDDLMRVMPETGFYLFGELEPWQHGIEEGPFVLRHAGRWYCFFSGDDCRSRDYSVGIGVADAITGPWRRMPGYRFIHRTGGLTGTGHGTPFKDASGAWRYVFHAHDSQDYFGPRRTYVSAFDFDKATGRPELLPGDKPVSCRRVSEVPNADGLEAGFVQPPPSTSPCAWPTCGPTGSSATSGSTQTTARGKSASRKAAANSALARFQTG